MPKFPSLSSKEFIKILEANGCIFVRQGATDQIIFGGNLETMK